jgi:hypothetical protein
MVVAQAGIAGSARIGRGAVIMSQAGIPDHVTIGERAYVGPKSGVHGDVADGERVMGYPHREMRVFQRIFAALGLLPALIARVRVLERAPAAGAAARRPRAKKKLRARPRASAKLDALADVLASCAPPGRGRRERAGRAGAPRCVGTGRRGARALADALERRERAERREQARLACLSRCARRFAAGARCVAGVDGVGMGRSRGPCWRRR